MIPLQDDTPSARKAYVTISMIVACCLVFLWQRSLDEAAARRVVAALGAIPAVLLTRARLPPDLEWIPGHASVVTSMFLHGGWLHFARTSAAFLPGCCWCLYSSGATRRCLHREPARGCDTVSRNV